MALSLCSLFTTNLADIVDPDRAPSYAAGSTQRVDLPEPSKPNYANLASTVCPSLMPNVISNRSSDWIARLP